MQSQVINFNNNIKYEKQFSIIADGIKKTYCNYVEATVFTIRLKNLKAGGENFLHIYSGTWPSISNNFPIDVYDKLNPLLQKKIIKKCGPGTILPCGYENSINLYLNPSPNFCVTLEIKTVDAYTEKKIGTKIFS